MTDSEFCPEHSFVKDILTEIKRDMRDHDEKINKISTKINWVLGAVSILPFMVGLIGILLKIK